MTKFVAIDFFCGAGGLTRGLQDAGISVALGIDNDESARDTYQKNNNALFWNMNIRKLKYSALDSFLAEHVQSDTVLIFAGCAPCQPFSKINRAGGTNDDVSLLTRFGSFVTRFRPDFVISENVPQITKHKEVFQRFVDTLHSAGYRVTYDLVDAKDYEVPQHRLRLVLLASRDIPIDMHSPFDRKVTVRDAIGHFPRLKAGQVHDKIPNHQSMNLSPMNYERITHTPRNGGDSRDWPQRLKVPCRRKSNQYYDVYGRMSWEKPGPTLTTRCISYSNGRFGHPEQHRAISVREAAAIQSFSNDYVFYGAQSIAARHIGNAVPPRLAQHLGKHLVESYERYIKRQKYKRSNKGKPTC